jgi:hypothetical protein
VTVCVNSVWFFGIWILWILWIDVDLDSECFAKGRGFGTFRGVLDLSEAIKEDLGENLCAYSEKELRQALRKRAGVKYYATGADADA